MLPKKQRITKRLFSESFSHSKTASNDYFTLKYKAFSEFPSKISVVVSKKVEKSAVGRNKLKRRIYEAVQKSSKKLEKAYVLMIFPKKTALSLDYKDLEVELLSVFKKGFLV